VNIFFISTGNSDTVPNRFFVVLTGRNTTMICIRHHYHHFPTLSLETPISVRRPRPKLLIYSNQKPNFQGLFTVMK
jgi:hypothetical protein